MGQALSKAEIEQGIRQFPHWNYFWDFGHGIRITADDVDQTIQTERLRRIFDPLCARFGSGPTPLQGLRVLDIGCNEGSFAVEARRLGATVVGIEPRPEKVEQARFVAQALGLDGIEYRVMSLWDLSPESIGVFDIVLFTGVLHHLDRPLEALRVLRPITGKVMVIDSQLLAFDYPMIALKEEGVDIPTNAFESALVCLVSEKALRYFLSYTGFGEVVTLPKPQGAVWKNSRAGRRYLRGAHGTLLAFPAQHDVGTQRRQIQRTGHEEVHAELFCSMLQPAAIRTGVRWGLRRWIRRLPGRIYHQRWVAAAADRLGLTAFFRKCYRRAFR